jgi:flavorubredoxin
MATITEIAPDVFRLSVYVSQFDLQFNHFLVRDDEPLLYHTGMRRMFADLRETVSRLLPPASLRWISWSHFEVDECGSLNEWLAVAPEAQPLCSQIGAIVNLADYANRPPRGLVKGETVATGRYRFSLQPTPHLPHGWDAGALFEETQGTLFCSDLFHQTGSVEPLTESGIVLERTQAALQAYQAGPLMDYLPYTPKTKRHLEELAALGPKTLAIMHGSSFSGNGKEALRALAEVYRAVFGQEG